MIVLKLPLPPSPNRVRTNRWAKRDQLNAYKRECWLKAVQQSMPPRRPAERMQYTAVFGVYRLRDEDNLEASLKPVLDALKRYQRSEDWKEGAYLGRGYFWDDDPGHLLQARKPRQERVAMKDQGLTLMLSEALL